MQPRILITAMFVTGALVFVSMARSAPPSTRIAIIDYAFEPAEQTITTGDSVTWQNEGQEPHNVVDAGDAWGSPELSSGQTYTVEFTMPGTYHYYCTIHAGMLGTITVSEPPPQLQTKIYIAAIQR